MRISLILQKIDCFIPNSAEDALEVHFAVGVNQTIDDMTSASVESVSNSLTPGPYDMRAGSVLDLTNLPPIGRDSWETKVITVSDDTNFYWVVYALELHHPELSGGSGGGGGSYQQLETLFYFNSPPFNANLLFTLIRDRVIRIYKRPDELSIRRRDRAFLRPAYSATLELRCHEKIGFTSHEYNGPKNEGTHFTVTDLPLEACRVPGPVTAWIVQQETTITFVPSEIFFELRYVWSVNGHELHQSELSVRISVQSEHFSPEASLDSETRQEELIFEYEVGVHGSLRFVCSSTSGNYDLDFSCKLVNSSGESIRVYSERKHITNEFVEGNEAYQKYIYCVQSFFRSLLAQLRQISDRTVVQPSEQPHFDPSGSWRRFDTVINEIEQRIAQIKAIRRDMHR